MEYLMMKNTFAAFEVWPGPMEGLGCNEFAAAVSALNLTDKWMTPFIRITNNLPATSKLRKQISSYLTSGIPVTIQLMGTSPQLLGECGRIVLDFPGTVGINLNAGCPSLRVVKHGAGGGMLKKPELLAVFCQEMAEYLPGRQLSIKLRSGYEDPDDMEIFLPALCKSGVISKIFFHYRTVLEGYSPAALPFRSQRIARAVKLCGDIPLIANGDISSVDDAQKLISQTHAAGVMIARPWLKDPYLLRRFTSIVPDAENGRKKFFAALQESGISGGALIETAKMLWGRESTEFKRLLDKTASPQ